MRRHRYHEDKFTQAIEHQTARVPSTVYLAGALGAMAASLTLHCLGRKKTSLFVGQWAAPILIMGLYNKVVKTKKQRPW